VIEARKVTKVYASPDRMVTILKDANFTVGKGKAMALVGRSGMGKTTVLNLLGGLDRPTSGELLFEGRHLERMDDLELSRLRNEAVGFVFQSFFLRSQRTALDNVMVPLLFGEMTTAEARDRGREVLKQVGLEQLADSRVSRLSGGQRQRVAIARAIANRPRLILADEPTGSLDNETGREICELLLEYNRTHKTTLVLVTHDPILEEYGVPMVTLSQGTLVPTNRA